MATQPITPRQRMTRRLTALKAEREPWATHWKDLVENFAPRAGRFLSSDRQTAGAKKGQSIVNGTPIWAIRVLSSGLMAGVTSPARSWFRLTTPDPALAEFDSVKQWLHLVEERIRQAFARSNIYNALHTLYGQMATFGTGSMLVEEDTESLLRAYVLPIGQYCLANSARLVVDTCYRETPMTVAQLADQFGLESCSQRVRSEYERSQLDVSVDVIHAVEPNRSASPGLFGPRGQSWSSRWFEATSKDDGSTGFLRERGFHNFPFMCPRWTVTGEDVYGSAPAMEALGDARALQLLEKRKAQVVDKIVTPPMRGPSSLSNQRVSLLPGDVTYVDSVQAGQTFAPAMEIHPSAVAVIEQTIREHEARIRTATYADLWLMLAQADSPQMTAREVSERHEEKMLQLGPVMERLEDELLDPLIDRAFDILSRAGYFPPPPQELQGIELRVEYISIMAQAQRLLGISAIERLSGFVGNLAAVKPEVLDKLDTDQMVDEYATMVGTAPAIVRSDEDVAAIRAQRAQAQAQQQQMAQAQGAVQGAQVLSQTDMQGDNGLTRLMGALGGESAALGTGR